MTKELTKKVKKSTAISGNTNKTLSSITPEKIAENTKKIKEGKPLHSFCTSCRSREGTRICAEIQR